VSEAYEVGGRRIGVRWSSAGLDAELRALCSNSIGIQEAPGNISVVLGTEAGGTRSKHQLHVQGQLLSTIDGDGGLIRAVIRALGTLAVDAPSGTISLHASLVVEPGVGAIAVDRRLDADLQRLAPLLRRRGRRVLWLPRLDVWAGRGSAALADAAAAAGVSVADLETRWPLQPGDDDLASGDVTITRFVYAGLPDPPSRLHVVAGMVPMASDESNRIARDDVARLADLVATVPSDGLISGSRNQLAALLGIS
jgi:hypothetical protein